MWQLAFVFASGALGSAHCIGMCGPFAVAIGAGSKHWRSNLARQLIYTLGRVFTYAFLGAVAGFGGWSLAEKTPWLAGAPAILAMVAGALLIVQGLLILGWLQWPWLKHSAGACTAASLFRDFFRQPGLSGVFLAGLFTGFLPCGLVYAFLAMAASSASVAGGAMTMTAFGLGTLPVMAATGLGGSLLRGQWRGPLFRLAACAVLVAGMASVARGYSFWTAENPVSPDACPFCEAEEDPAAERDLTP